MLPPTVLFVVSLFAGLAQSFMTQGFTLDGSDGFPDWKAAHNDGARFVTIRATQGNLDIDQLYQENWSDAKKNGFIRAAYHVGRPNIGSGKEQAEFFLKHGGRWVADNMTLPGILEVKAPEVGNSCWGLNSNQTRQWLNEWTETYFNATRMRPLLRTNLLWYDNCTDYWFSLPSHAGLAVIDNSDSPPNDHDLEIDYYDTWTLWQNGDYYKYGGYSEMWHGGYEYLKSSTTKKGN
ncbi:glycoside hydrolase superfamily [Aspergillus ambiguus]|uniref:glycoside hydrolase superfamily n=1 Tax=Aspergillus ambiguus TaxID=176160 RepID=UPI003CCD0527